MSDVVNNRDKLRFELTIDGSLAELVYELHNGRLQLMHTEVPSELEGRGVGGTLVTAAVDHAAEHRLIVEPYCPFARGWLERHPDVAGRVTIEWPTELSP